MSPLVLFLFSFFLFIAGGAATPVLFAKRAIDVATLANLNLFEQFAAAAYCTNNHNSTGSKLICTEGNCPLVQAADTNTVLEFQDSLATDVTGYVATDRTNRLIVVSFRGSRSLRNWLTNINFPVTDTGLCPNCTAHQGFWNSWVEARATVTVAVASAAIANPGYQIVSTGHSLGGAIAGLAAAQLRNSGYTVALYTYGAPRVASATLSDYITTQPGGNYRVTHTNDPVPRLPPDVWDFSHISPEYYISSANQVPVTTNDVTQLQGPNNPAGNAGRPDFEFNAHLWYFSNTSACSPGQFEI